MRLNVTRCVDEVSATLACTRRCSFNWYSRIHQAIATVLEKWSRIDILVNNAVDFPRHASSPMRFESIPADHWQPLMISNVHGPFAAVQAVLPSMRKSKWGRIVNVSSVAAEDGIPGFGWYAVAKASLHGLTSTLARELSEDGILVNTVMPGPTLTERFREEIPSRMLEKWAQTTGIRRMPAPEEVAKTIVFLCSPANTIMTGETVRSGGRGGCRLYDE